MNEHCGIVSFQTIENVSGESEDIDAKIEEYKNIIRRAETGLVKAEARITALRAGGGELNTNFPIQTRKKQEWYITTDIIIILDSDEKYSRRFSSPLFPILLSVWLNSERRWVP